MSPGLRPSNAGGTLRRQRGLTLIELMISLTLGLIIVLAVGYVYVNGRQGYRLNDNLARIQENGRIAMEMIGRDVRMAGFIGCPNLAQTPAVVRAQTPPPPLTAGGTFSLAQALAGVETATAGNWADIPAGLAHVPGTDVLFVRRAGEQSAALTADMGSPSAAVTVAGNPLGLAADDLVLLSDCRAADIFRVTALDEGAGTLAHDTSGNTSAALSRSYASGARLSRFELWEYFVARNGSGQAALYRRPAHRPGANPQAWVIAEGVEDLQVRYGLDTDGDGQVDALRTASAIGTAAEWAQVVSVQVHLLVAGPDDGQAPAAQTLRYRDINGDDAADDRLMPDRRLYQVFTASFGLRNRLP